MTAVAWIRDLTDFDAPLVRLVQARLRNDLRESDAAPFGILLLRSIQSDSTRQIRALAGGAKIIVLLGPDLRLHPDGKWSLLAAGAADVLEWPGQEQLAAQIVPRIERWTEIETLMTGDLALLGVIGESAAWQKALRDAVEIASFSQSVPAVDWRNRDGEGANRPARTRARPPAAQEGSRCRRLHDFVARAHGQRVVRA